MLDLCVFYCYLFRMSSTNGSDIDLSSIESDLDKMAKRIENSKPRRPRPAPNLNLSNMSTRPSSLASTKSTASRIKPGRYVT